MKLLIVFFWLMIPSFGYTLEATNIGQVATNLEQPILIATDFIYNASVIIGICALFGAFLRYMQYRVNPLASPISTVIVLLILGIVLVCLPLISHVIDIGVPYHYF